MLRSPETATSKVDILRGLRFRRGGRLGDLRVELHHLLVVAVHEVDLEALDAHRGEMLADSLHVAVHGPVAGPEDDADAFGVGVVHDLLQVDLRDHLEEVGLVLDGPALVQDRVFDALRGGEVDVVFIGLRVDTGLEVHAVEVPVVPPVPGYLAGLDPGEVSLGGGGKAPDKVRLGQEAVFALFGREVEPAVGRKNGVAPVSEGSGYQFCDKTAHAGQGNGIMVHHHFFQHFSQEIDIHVILHLN